MAAFKRQSTSPFPDFARHLRGTARRAVRRAVARVNTFDPAHVPAGLHPAAPERKAAMSRKVRLVLVSLGLSVVSALAQGQPGDRWTQEVRNQLRIAAALFERSGWSLTQQVYTGTLAHRQSEYLTAVLEPRYGGYILVGVCDEDCTDLDLEIFDLFGDKVSEDVKLDDTPVVAVDPERSTRYRVRVTMANCSSSPCYYGIGVFGRGQTE